MTTTPLFAASALACSSSQATHAASISRDLFHVSWRHLLVSGRPMRGFLVCKCSKNAAEKVETGSRGTQLRLEDLKIGGVYKGKVSAVESYGVFVDIGAHVDGFVHNSRLARPLHVRTALRVGQDVTVQIVDLDPRADSLSLLLAPEEELTESLKLQPLSVSEKEVCSRAAARRANKIAAQRGDILSARRVVSLETRQRLKAHRRAVLAEQQAIQLYLARSKTSSCQPFEGLLPVDDPPG